jgi:hypothetical protein
MRYYDDYYGQTVFDNERRPLVDREVETPLAAAFVNTRGERERAFNVITTVED